MALASCNQFKTNKLNLTMAEINGSPAKFRVEFDSVRVNSYNLFTFAAWIQKHHP